MPIYEYVCRDCGEAFEELVFGEERPRCPRCESARAEKQFSAFAVGGGAAPGPELGSGPGACGTCGDPRGPGACSLN